MTTRAWGEAYRTTMICVDTYQSGVLSGRLYNRSLASGKSFRCLTQLLEAMESTLDDMEYPKSFTAPRRFTPRKEGEDTPANSQDPKGEWATFAVRILFRQNASWQGSVAWMEGKQEQSFRSALELIFLINSALEHKEAS